MAADLAPIDNEDDVELTPAQVQALDKLDKLGAGLPEKDESGKSIYSSDPQVRAFQLVAEGRLGGAGRGQGRKRKPRVGEHVAAEMRKRGDKIVAAIDKGLDSDNDRTALQAADMAVKIDRDESLLQLKEEEQDLDKLSKEELVATLFQLVSDPGTQAQLEAVIDIPPEDVVEVQDDNDVGGNGNGSAVHTKKARANARSHRSNGRGPSSRDRAKGGNPFTEAARRRAAD